MFFQSDIADLGLAFVLVLLFVLTMGAFILLTRSSVKNQVSVEISAAVQPAVVGQTYPFSGSFMAKLRVGGVDADKRNVWGNLLIELDPGCEIKSVQKGWDASNEDFVCVTYVEGNVWKTLTWYWNDATWPEFDSYEVTINEIEVTVAS